ncbi:MAG TPA: group II intron reverse transcriptase/maturase, partial [Ktedonobacterales bacterium]|nr:group II intron reverse transcriptase/maturase [Ktedonobacterales bacterium]
GTPQGGIVSPLLANIYLDRLDQFVETTLLPAYTRGVERRLNPEYNKLACQRGYLKRTGRLEQAEALRSRLQALPNSDTYDPAYRRLRYLRYADDFLLGFTGSRAEAEDIKQQLDTFLRERLNLDLSPTKTLITHGRSEAARFLGYEVVVQHNDHKLDARRRRTANALIGLRVPQEVVKAKCARYLRNGRPIHRGERLHDTPFSIISQYQAEYRGLVNYYQLATNLGALQHLYWVMSVSLAKTLAAKLRMSCNQVFQRYKTVIQTPQGPRKALQVTIERAGKPPLVATWGGISLAHTKWNELGQAARLRDQLPRVINGRTELEKRLLADICELCGSRENVQVHHIRALKDLRPKGSKRRTPRPAWVELMAQRRRKTLVVCRRCHWDMHAGRVDGSPRRADASADASADARDRHTQTSSDAE